MFAMKSRDQNGSPGTSSMLIFIWTPFYLYIAMLLGAVYSKKLHHIKMSREKVTGDPIKRCSFLAQILKSETYAVGSN